MARVAVVVAVIGSTAGMAAGVSHAASISDRPAFSRLGFDPGYANLPNLQSLQQWLERDTSYVVQFSEFDTEADFQSSVWGETVGAGAFQPVAAQTTLVESVPLTIGLGYGATTEERAAALQDTLSGAHDAAYTLAAQYLQAGGFGSVVVRLGWEFDGDWMPWSANGNEALWADAYRHVADVFRSVMPDVRFDWTGDPMRLESEVAAYPGDDYVDIVGMDVYDKGRPTEWDDATQTWVDPEAAFETSVPSLTFQRDFAIEHGKQVSFPEWALADGGTESPTNAGYDDPTFVQRMFDWMNSLPSDGPGSLAYHAYFNEDTTSDGLHQLDHFPQSQMRFRTLFGAAPALVQPLPIRRASVRPGYSMLSTDGTVYAFGGAKHAGDAPGAGIAIAERDDGSGYWVTDAAGNVDHFGAASGFGSHPTLRSDEWVSAISATRSGNGYWLFTTRGRVFAYGDAHPYGDLAAVQLNGPVVASVATSTGRGYYMVGSDGGVFGFGDARFHGSMGSAHLNAPIVGLSPTPDGRGYWLVASDGGVFAFDAPFRGSMGRAPLVQPVKGLVAYGNGYLMVAADGGLFDFSDRAFEGSLGDHPPRHPIVGIAAVRA